MIITLTLNPAMDKTVHVPTLLPGGLNRIGDIVLNAGGKGVNVSKMIATLGGTSIATGFCGGSVGRDFLQGLEEMGLTHNFLQVAGNTRINTKVIDETYGLTELNEPGVQVTGDEEALLIERLFQYAQQGAIIILSGSLHANASPDFYLELTSSLQARGATVFLDADGASFAKALTAKPRFIKPNNEELKAYCGKADMTNQELFEVCKGFVRDGIPLVALSMGGEGAALFAPDEAYYVPCLKVEVSSTVGAGDSMVGGVAFATEQGYSLKDTIALAVACGTGAVTTRGTVPPSLELVNQLKTQVQLQAI